MSKMYNPPHPGRMLAESLEYLGVSARSFAKNLGVSTRSVNRILHEKGPITADMAVRISAALPGPTPEMWLTMQADYDAWQAEHRIDTSSVKRYKAPNKKNS